jgi:hypothetical protein
MSDVTQLQRQFHNDFRELLFFGRAQGVGGPEQLDDARLPAPPRHKELPLGQAPLRNALFTATIQ